MFYAALERLKEDVDADEVNALFADVPFGAIAVNPDASVSIALTNGYAINVRVVEGRAVVDVYAITEVFDERQTAGAIDQIGEESEDL